MAEREDYHPQPAPNNNEGYTKRSFSYCVGNLKERYADHIAKGYHEETPAEHMTSLLARMDEDAGYKNSAVHDGTKRVRWAFIALTYLNYPPYGQMAQEAYIRQYNEFHKERQEQGESTTGITVSGEQTQLLVWMLDQIGVAHEFQDGDITVPFAPMEAKMRQISQKYGNPRLPIIGMDHEATTSVSDLMDAWKNTQEGNGQS